MAETDPAAVGTAKPAQRNPHSRDNWLELKAPHAFVLKSLPIQGRAMMSRIVDEIAMKP
jgi:hypothetical protein